jgi:hypothetical protein
MAAPALQPLRSADAGPLDWGRSLSAAGTLHLSAPCLTFCLHTTGWTSRLEWIKSAFNDW